MSGTDAQPPPLIIFLHITKTGGMTLRQIIRRQYPSDMVHTVNPRLPSLARLREICQTLPPETAALQGHMRFRAHEFLTRRFTYITLLRDPVDRVISNYYHVLSHAINPLHETLHSEGTSLREFASGGRFLEHENRQTWFLSGSDPWSEPCTGTLLETAKRNLREHFSVVGLTERFDESLMLLKRTFGWRPVLYSRRNVATNRPPREAIDRDTVRAIECANQLDLELYEYARGRFEEQLGRQRFDFEIELEAFKRLNGQYPGCRRSA